MTQEQFATDMAESTDTAKTAVDTAPDCSVFAEEFAEVLNGVLRAKTAEPDDFVYFALEDNKLKISARLVTPVFFGNKYAYYISANIPADTSSGATRCFVLSRKAATKVAQAVSGTIAEASRRLTAAKTGVSKAVKHLAWLKAKIAECGKKLFEDGEKLSDGKKAALERTIEVCTEDIPAAEKDISSTTEKAAGRIADAEKRVKAVENVAITIGNGTAEFSCGGFSLELITCASATLDCFDDVEYAAELKTTQAELYTLIDSVAYCTELKSAVLSVSHHVNIRTSPIALIATATTGVTAATASTVKLSKQGDINVDVNIPIEVIRAVKPLLSQDDNDDLDVTISANKTEAQILFGNWQIYTECCVEEFPTARLAEILEEEDPVDFTVENTEKSTGLRTLITALNAVAPMTKNSDSPCVELEISDGDLTISASAEKVGKARCFVDALVHGCEYGTAKICVNLQYLLDMLAHAEDTNVTFGMSSTGLFYRTENVTALVTPYRTCALPKGVQLPTPVSRRDEGLEECPDDLPAPVEVKVA